MHSLTNNNAWYRQIAAGWARRMINGDSPGAWAHNTESDVQFAITQLNLQPGAPVLDLGCGWGRHSLPLAAYGLRVTGLDISHDLLRLARYNAQRHALPVNWVEGDIAAVPLRGAFEAVVQFYGNFMTWFADPAQTLEALWNVASLLRPGGCLLFGSSDWQPELPPRSQKWDEWQGGAAIYRQRYDDEHRIAHTQAVIFGPEHERREYNRQTWWPSPREMEQLFAQAGLSVYRRFNVFEDAPFNPYRDGLVYLLVRERL
ncbi:MAG: class I SAM-dependent methyltransferase [Anaerolineae bacterium]|nr:class I SAM-dependent methyltransferase [Anaerolineae bacterium]